MAIKYVARSKLKKNFKNKNTFAYKMLEGQVATLKKIVHPHLVRLQHFVDDSESSYLYFISDYVPKGSILDHVSRNGPLDIDSCRKFFIQIVSGLQYAHTAADVIHRNVALHNILLDVDGNVKLADLSHRVLLGEDGEKEDVKGAIYAAPEVIKNASGKTEKSDIWGVGVCLYFMLTGQSPFNGKTVSEIHNEVLSKPYALFLFIRSKIDWI